MSNYLAIATVTATLQRILQTAVQLDVPGARATTARPDASSGGTPEVGVNIYLYKASPNPVWRNADLSNRRPKADLIKRAQAGLDLYYLMTFYGNEVELEPQRLLGSTIRTLVDQPILTADIIRETIRHPNFTYLQESTLAEQVEQVAIVPTNLSTDDLSKIWSVFFQTPYLLSFAFQGGAVLIEGDRPSGRNLPVRSRQFYTASGQPLIERVLQEEGNQPIVSESRLCIRGQRLAAETTPEQLQAEAARAARFPDPPYNPSHRRWTPYVQIGDARLTPHTVANAEIQLRLADLPTEERTQLRAGVQSLQVVYPLLRTHRDLQALRNGTPPERTAGTNTMAFVLCPTIVGELQVDGIQRDGEQILVASVTVRTDLTIGVGQRVFLMLNQRTIEDPASYIFAARPTNDSESISFIIRDIKPGEYLARLQVDGAESLLEFDGTQYIRPTVVIQS